MLAPPVAAHSPVWRPPKDTKMTTMTTLNDVRAALIAQGYPAEQVDAMLNLAGRMVLEGSLASKDDLNGLRDELKNDVNGLRDEFTAFKIDVAAQFAQLRTEMNVKFAEQRTEMEVRFGEMRVENARSENRIIKWVFGAIFAGVVFNVTLTSLLLVILPRLVD